SGAVALGWMATSFGTARPGSLSYFGHLLVVAGALLAGWLFAKRHHRLFSPDENGCLISYCICWVILLEGAGLAVHPEILSLPFPLLFGALLFGLGIDALIVWLSFRFVVRKALIQLVPPSLAMDVSASSSSPISPSVRATPYVVAPLVVLVIMFA